MIKLRKNILLVAIAVAQLLPWAANAQEQENEKLNNFTIDAELLTRGELPAPLQKP